MGAVGSSQGFPGGKAARSRELPETTVPRELAMRNRFQDTSSRSGRRPGRGDLRDEVLPQVRVRPLPQRAEYSPPAGRLVGDPYEEPLPAPLLTYQSECQLGNRFPEAGSSSPGRPSWHSDSGQWAGQRLLGREARSKNDFGLSGSPIRTKGAQ